MIRFRVWYRVWFRIRNNEPYALFGITNLQNNEPYNNRIIRQSKVNYITYTLCPQNEETGHLPALFSSNQRN